ncbi:hypothetical protein PAESOLCIP111_06178 [Paenibacillus solanacearum]|uniref:Uncharacterized protein n=1 Tax=Paenibacillus solanacearum TaxID=2048548 RepID=A0A916K7E5_9BACL|nr:hypothetical protein [Paenibacillus solanacearum]CAG7650797.1 hypothetical protein PAESOLCIP111_06178 [Paenibacillus solanacearum]
MQTSETGNFEMDKHQPGAPRREINGSGRTKFTSNPSFGLARAARIVLMAMLLFTAICAFRFPAGTQAADMVWKPLTDAYVSDRGTYYNQIIADNGTLYYAYRDDDLYAADRLTNKVVVKKYDGQQWTDTGPIATGNVDSIRLALDPSDHVLYVAFVQNWVAKVFKLTNGGWESLGSVKSNTAAISLAVNNGVPYVTFEDGGNSSKLTVMKYNNGNQTWGPVGTPNYFNYKRATNTMPRIEVSGHIVYVAYKQNTSSTVIDLSVMMFDEDQPANGWQQVGSLLPSVAESGLLYHDFYVFDGTPYVAYQDRGNSKKLRVVKYVNTNWESVGPDQGIVSVGKADYASLAKDNNGLYLAYQDGTNDNKLMVKQYNGNAWMPVGDAAIQRKEVYYTSLSADNGKLYVAYQDDDTLLSNPVANARAFVITYGTPLSVALSDIPVPFGTVKSNALPSTIPMTWSVTRLTRRP